VPLAAGEDAFYKGVSEDGVAVAFEVNGTLYVRLDNQETKEVATGTPTFAGVSDGGSYVFYVVGGEMGTIHRFNSANGTDAVVNPFGEGAIVNISDDGSHVYFISTSELGGEGEAGKPNLYVWSGASSEYIATVAQSDLEQTSGDVFIGTPALDNWTGWVVNRPKTGSPQGPGNESSRTTPDGHILTFESRAELTSYDSDGHTAIYRFDGHDNSLICVSCSPTVEPATEDARFQELARVHAPTVVDNMTADGKSVFFETRQALVGTDTTGVNDIYEWQEEEGGGSSINLISSGQSIEYPKPDGVDLPSPPTPNFILSVTPDGEDVVFLAQDALLPGAGGGGTQAIYDARVNGGFASPPAPPVCFEEGCKPPVGVSIPSFLRPLSLTQEGKGNVKPRKQRRCRKTKSKKKRRCAKHKHRHLNPGRASVLPETGRPADSARGTAAGPMSATEPIEKKSAADVAMSAENPFDYGFETVSAEESTSDAGMHPDFSTEITLNHITNSNDEPELGARTEEVAVLLPPGLLGDPTAIPQCKTGQLVAYNCPIDSQVGIAKVLATFISGEAIEPIYNLEPPHPGKEVARFGFTGVFFPVFLDIRVRSSSDYGVTATVYGSSGFVSLVSAKTTFWGNPADAIHNKERLTPIETLNCSSGTACEAPGGERESGLDPTAFMTNPSACQSMEINVVAKSYQLPGQVFTANAPMDPITACQGLPFAPSFEATPTSRMAGAPAGLQATLRLPQQSPEAVDSPATATTREARVSLPGGMSIAAGAADGIAACTEEQVGFHQEIDASCPDASKLGTASITSPALPQPLEGAIYQRTPTPGHQFGLWLVTDELGLHVKIPGEIEPDPDTGRLTAVFKDLPQVPVEEIDLNVWGGPRAPLKNPDECGTYQTTYAFAPHSSDPAVTGQSQMTIDQGCDQGFSPKLEAGVTDPVAGAFSPFVFDLTREDGEQSLRGFELTLPPGELAKIKGVQLCPDEAASAGSCPADSKIGHLLAASGPGPHPLWLPQPGKTEPSIHLAGPYHGAPFSIVTEVPAQAGPFDLGVVSVRSALEVDRETALATVKADPLPQFFEGVGLSYRRIHAVIDRPGFALNPTDCREMAVESKVISSRGTVATPASRFQVDGCKALAFKPKLSLELSGGTERSDYPALKAIVRARKGDANIGKVSVALPHSEFLAQEHIATICTRKRFAAHKCPKGSIYGKAKAWTPLLAKPLSGSVYLRSSDNPLPDLVMDLKGELEIAVAGRIDSKNGGIRTTFESVPDAPITKVVLRMKGGEKSLLTNSTDICRGIHRATVEMRAQNGRALSARPALASKSCARKHKR